MNNIEGMTPRQEAENEFREANIEERKVEADAQNKSRPTIEKALRRNKLTEKDIAHKEAIEMDEEIDRRIESGEAENRQEAINQINLISALTKSTDQYIKLREHLVQYNEISYSQVGKIKEIDELAIQRLKDRMHESPVKYMLERKMMLANGVLNKDNIDEEEIKSIALERLAQALQEDPISYMIEGVGQITAGIFGKEELANIPEIKEIAQERLVRSLQEDSIIPYIFERDNQVRAKIMTAEEISNLPGVQKTAKERLEQARKDSDAYYEVEKQSLRMAGLTISET
ncbi:hypothetical protein C4544_07095 [candidate division WS5 bacterium]|uniref:Uncharacterized protein n=1 Tax=candidate division WS5 bacterium TaxID=2093353 RepID=A0A419DAE6_9BACT|nr:MAG: hypothetical protein C4544_07095 [candidate division WS5 bacterium]